MSELQCEAINLLFATARPADRRAVEGGEVVVNFYDDTSGVKKTCQVDDVHRQALAGKS